MIHCLLHIYFRTYFIITIILKQWPARNQETFAAFIDVEKTFDRIDRNLLFYKLLRYKINGKMYCSDKLLYHTVNCVRLGNFLTARGYTVSYLRI